MIMYCSGPHATPTVVGATDSNLDLGMLCDLCGVVYATEVSNGSVRAGIIPDANKVAKVLTDLKIVYDKAEYQTPKGTP